MRQALYTLAAELSGRLSCYSWAQGRRRAVFAALCGVACGLLNSLLCLGIAWAGDLWRGHLWLSGLLPLLGAAEVLLYRQSRVKLNLTPGFDYLIDSMKSNEPLPLKEGPDMFLGTFLSLLGGASVGPDSSSKHMGAVVGTWMLKHSSLKDDQGKPTWSWAVACGLAACFSALLCAPLGVFAYLVEHLRARRIPMAHLPSILLSCFVATAVAAPFHLQLATPEVGLKAASSADLGGAACVALACALMGVVFGWGVRLTERLRSLLGQSPMKCLVIGGCLVGAALLLIPGLSRWGGVGSPLITEALSQAQPGWGFALKLLLTILCLGFGLRGGEVTTLFVVGALLGSSIAAALGASPLICGALATVTLYGIALGSPISGVLVGCEFFGWGFAPWLIPCVALAWLAAQALNKCLRSVHFKRL